VSVYDRDPSHPAVRREKKNDERRAAALVESTLERSRRRRVRGPKGTPWRNTVTLLEGKRTEHSVRELWYHPTKGYRVMTVPT